MFSSPNVLFPKFFLWLLLKQRWSCLHVTYKSQFCVMGSTIDPSPPSPKCQSRISYNFHRHLILLHSNTCRTNRFIPMLTSFNFVNKIFLYLKIDTKFLDHALLFSFENRNVDGKQENILFSSKNRGKKRFGYYTINSYPQCLSTIQNTSKCNNFNWAVTWYLPPYAIMSTSRWACKRYTHKNKNIKGPGSMRCINH